MQVGKFTFSAQFYAYRNPQSMCGECELENNVAITCERANVAGPDTTTCGLRFIYCLRPHGSPASNVFFPGQSPLAGGEDNVTFEEDFIVQSNSNYGIWNRSNPFMRELQQWPVSL